MNKSGKYVMVLEDGTTYAGWQGSYILYIPPNIEDDEMDHYVKENVNENGFAISLLTKLESIECWGDLFIPDVDSPDYEP
jgi:hypothetical protein